MDSISPLRNIPFSFENRIANIINKRLNRHPSSAPFLSGDTFRCIADYVMDTDPVTPVPEVRHQGVFFLSSWRLQEFRNKVLCRLGRPIVLVTHHGDINIDERFWDIAESPLVLRWFAQNAIKAHPKIEPLPIGLEDQKNHNNGHVRDFVRLRRRKFTKEPRIVWGFSLRTNPDERFPCYRNLWHNPVADEIYWAANARNYRKTIVRFMFVASPPGNGFDCHRAWEALYLSIVPIVLHKYPYVQFQQQGLPFLMVRDWSELRDLREEGLRRFYESNVDKFNNPLLYLPYWVEKIGHSLSAAV